MQSKGQLFSLDLIIAVALVILALGLLYRQAELFQYFQKDDTMQAELYRIGLNASNQLVSNPAIVCQLIDSSSNVIDYLPNCIPKSNQPRITELFLGLPAGFSYCIENAGTGHFLNPRQYNKKCTIDGPASSVKNVFSIDRKIVIFNGQGNETRVDKKALNNCVLGTCSNKFNPATVRLKVWKA